MKLILFHPTVATRSCEDCKAWVYNIQTGQKEMRRGKPVPRGKAPTPCWSCPKESPEKASQHELSEKNWRTFELYRRVQATGGACLTDAMRNDELLMSNLAIIDRVFTAHERKEAATALALELAGLLAGAAAK